MIIHHIGYLVDDAKAAIEEFLRLGFEVIRDIMEDTSRLVYIAFLKNGDYVIELIQPVSKESPIYGLRAKHRNSPYHICYETKCINGEISRLSGEGYLLFLAPQAAPAIEGTPLTAFMLHHKIGMVELVQIMDDPEY